MRNISFMLTTAMLDEHEAAQRTNRSNDGRAFQKEMESTFGAYQSQRIATVRKADPPVAVIWPYNPGTKRREQRVIFKANPWLDFVGCWIARHGRMLIIEAKSTSTHRLPFNCSRGLTTEQIASVNNWRHSGAAVCVVWRFNDRATLWTPEMLAAAEGRGDKSLVFENGAPVPRGEGSLIWDFLPVLERALWSSGDSASIESIGKNSTAAIAGNKDIALYNDF